jgi:molecular chaperone DnaK
MKVDANLHASEDKKKREEIDLKNQADNLVFQTEKQMKEYGEKLAPDVRGKVEGANEKLRDAIKGGNPSAIKSAMDSLNNAWNEASAQMYQQASQAAGQKTAGGSAQGPAGEQPKADEKKVEDAQYEVVDDKDKEKK